MATADKIKQRIATFVLELAEELGEADEREALCWLDAIETQTVAIGDAVSVALLKRKAQNRPVADDQATCPTCGKLGRYQGLRERELISRRGPVPIAEPEYYCPACRRDFFPDGQRARS
jgi:hypothetical protein